MPPENITAIDRLIRAEDLASLLSLSVRQTWRLDRAGKLPAPIRIGRAVRWRESEIRAWIEANCPPREEWAARWPAIFAAQTSGRLRISRPPIAS